jgi:hypothetical protein
MRLELMRGFALPAATTLTPTLKLLEVQLDPRTQPGRITGLHLPFALGLQARLRLSERLSALITGAQPGRRLITPIITMAIVLDLVGVLGISQELIHD